jgi:GR25 family glycosyltransferase involved in LPS biosynthesis
MQQRSLKIDLSFFTSKTKKTATMKKSASSTAAGVYVPPHRRRLQQSSPAEDAAASSYVSRPSFVAAGTTRRITRSMARSTPPAVAATSAVDDDDAVALTAASTSTTTSTTLLPTLMRCINLASRTDKWRHVQEECRNLHWAEFTRQLIRFDAIDGDNDDVDTTTTSYNDVAWEWDSSVNALYSPSKVTAGIKRLSSGEVGCARSHIALWRELVAYNNGTDTDDDVTMLILEDDIAFTKHQGKSRFRIAFAKAWRLLPPQGEWGMLYLGFSGRGARKYVTDITNTDDEEQKEQPPDHHPLTNPTVQLYQPEYGYHTHAYVITKAAARILLQQLPVTGPIDVWLADHRWFNIQVYCAVIANEGWRRTDEDGDGGQYEGALLVRQDRRRARTSDIAQSANNNDHHNRGNNNNTSANSKYGNKSTNHHRGGRASWHNGHRAHHQNSPAS